MICCCSIYINDNSSPHLMYTTFNYRTCAFLYNTVNSNTHSEIVATERHSHCEGSLTLVSLTSLGREAQILLIITITRSRIGGAHYSAALSDFGALSQATTPPP